MTTSLDLRTFGRDLEALNDRVARLRSSRLSSGDNDVDTLDAALLELETAEEELRACRDELETSSQQLARRSGRHERERQLLRQVFRHAPFGLFVLDPAGAIRLANPRAAAMTGTPLEFLGGKPMPVFVDLVTRAAFRSHLAAVLRTGRGSLIGCQILGRGHREDVQLVLSRLTGPDSEHPLALAAAWTGIFAAEDAPPAVPRPGQVPGLVDGSLRLDVMGRMTRLLLSQTDDAGLLPAAAHLLVSDYADWAVIDLVQAGRPARQAVAGPRGPVTAAEPDATVIRDVIATGGPIVLDPIEDDEAFGRTPAGAPVLAAMRAGSLVSVALPGPEPVAGVLTLIRRNDRRGFALADVGLCGELAAHLAMALAGRGLLDDARAAVPR